MTPTQKAYLRSSVVALLLAGVIVLTPFPWSLALIAVYLFAQAFKIYDRLIFLIFRKHPATGGLFQHISRHVMFFGVIIVCLLVPKPLDRRVGPLDLRDTTVIEAGEKILQGSSRCEIRFEDEQRLLGRKVDLVIEEKVGVLEALARLAKAADCTLEDELILTGGTILFGARHAFVLEPK